MIRYLDECVCCDIPCIDCGRKRTPHFYCDRCGKEIDAEGYESFKTEWGEYLCDSCEQEEEEEE